MFPDHPSIIAAPSALEADRIERINLADGCATALADSAGHGERAC